MFGASSIKLILLSIHSITIVNFARTSLYLYHRHLLLLALSTPLPPALLIIPYPPLPHHSAPYLQQERGLVQFRNGLQRRLHLQDDWLLGLHALGRPVRDLRVKFKEFEV